LDHVQSRQSIVETTELQEQGRCWSISSRTARNPLAITLRTELDTEAQPLGDAGTESIVVKSVVKTRL
jgi:hypothetical protein